MTIKRFWIGFRHDPVCHRLQPRPGKDGYEEFYKFHRYLEETFPLIHQHLEKEVVSRASLLYRWKGDGSSNRLPIALIAHQDVVPVGEESQWEHGAVLRRH